MDASLRSEEVVQIRGNMCGGREISLPQEEGILGLGS
jgi:hypothetical protein